VINDSNRLRLLRLLFERKMGMCLDKSCRGNRGEWVGKMGRGRDSAALLRDHRRGALLVRRGADGGLGTTEARKRREN
jgi:hypothetical protein